MVGERRFFDRGDDVQTETRAQGLRPRGAIDQDEDPSEERVRRVARELVSENFDEWERYETWLGPSTRGGLRRVRSGSRKLALTRESNQDAFSMLYVVS